jgi:phosphoribosylanthranilate isomerase
MTLVKICGITNLEDALVSIEAGADALGFNFYKRSPRYIEPHEAKKIILQLPNSVLNVGVFVNEDAPEDVALIADEAKLNAVQLHGEESPSYCDELKKYHVIKALRVSDEFKPEDVLKFNVEAILLDAYSRDAYGGIGKVFDWTIARETQKKFPKLFLAGGLTPDNVAQAIKQVEPYAVDACSSLEITHGKKDATKVREFVKAIREMKG